MTRNETTNASPLLYGTRDPRGVSTGGAVRFAFLMCGFISFFALIAALISYVREPSAGQGYRDGIDTLRVMPRVNESPDDGPAAREAWRDLLRLPVPLFLLVAGLRSTRPRLEFAIRIARLLAAAMLIGVAADEWLAVAESYTVPLGVRRRLAQAVSLLAFDHPLVPLLVAAGIWPMTRRAPFAVAFGLVLAAYASAMILNFVDAAYAVFTPVGFVEWDDPSMFVGVAKFTNAYSSWLTYPMSYETPPPLHTVRLLWASAIGAIVAGACLWTNRLWLRWFGAASLLPLAIVCAADRLIPWLFVGAAWRDHADEKLIDRLLLIGERCELAYPTLPLVAFAFALIFRLLTRPTLDPTPGTIGRAARRAHHGLDDWPMTHSC